MYIDKYSDLEFTCDMCLRSVKRSLLKVYPLDAVPEHVKDQRGGYYYFCVYCIGDKQLLKESEKRNDSSLW
jgi:hypothetical protein